MRRGLCGQNCRNTAATVGNCRTAVDRSAPAAAKHCAHEPLPYSARLAASPIAGGITEFVSATALLFGILSATAAERLAVKPALGSVVLHAKFEVGMAECVFAAALQNENMRCQVNGGVLRARADLKVGAAAVKMAHFIGRSWPAVVQIGQPVVGLSFIFRWCQSNQPGQQRIDFIGGHGGDAAAGDVAGASANQ